MSFRTPLSYCAHCRAEISAAWHEDGGIPRPGDFSMCASCGSWLVFDDSLHVRMPTREDRERLHRSRQAQKLHALWVQFMKEKKGAKIQ